MSSAYSWLQLARLHTPAPIGLLLWPTLWAVWLASLGSPTWQALGIFCLGGVGMRTVGCMINDLADYDIDKQVMRTKSRPLAQGLIQHKHVKLAIIGLLCLLATLLLWLNRTTQILACTGVVLSIIYPLSKRYISCPQLVLGLCFAWGVPMAYAYHNQLADPRGWLLYLLVAVWVVAYDTIYALQDKSDDKKLNIGSMALWLDQHVITAIAVAYLIFWLGCGLVGRLYSLSFSYFTTWIIAGSMLGYQVRLLGKKPADHAKLFRLNQWIGLLLLVGIVASY